MISWVNYFGSVGFQTAVTAFEGSEPAVAALAAPFLGGWDSAPEVEAASFTLKIRPDLDGQKVVPPAVCAILGLRPTFDASAGGAARTCNGELSTVGAANGWGGFGVPGGRSAREAGANWAMVRASAVRPTREAYLGNLAFGQGSYLTTGGAVAYSVTAPPINGSTADILLRWAVTIPGGGRLSQMWVGPGVPYLPHHAAPIDTKNDARGERAFAGALLATPGERGSYREMQLRYLIPEEWFFGVGGISDLAAIGPGVEIVCVIDPAGVQIGGGPGQWAGRGDIIHGLLTGITAVRHARRGAVNYSVTLSVTEAV